MLPFQRRMAEANGWIKRPRAQRRPRRHPERRGITSAPLADEVGKRRVKAKRAKVARRRNRPH